MRLRALVNPARDAASVAPADTAARDFHHGLAGYHPTGVHALPALAAELGLRSLAAKDETDRLGLPAFKILGAAWAVERALRERPLTRLLVAASAGNHGRAVARAAGDRGLACRIYLPASAPPDRTTAIASEGADVVVVNGTYAQALTVAAAAGRETGVVDVADTGAGATAAWVIDGYGTLFHELAGQGDLDAVFVPVGVGSLAAAAARYGAATGTAVVGVEPLGSTCLAASLRAGAPVNVQTEETVMGVLRCEAVSTAAWPLLRAGVAGTVAVSDDEAAGAASDLTAAGIFAGTAGAAALAGVRVALTDPEASDLRRSLGLGADSRVAVVVTEGAEVYRPHTQA